MPNTLPVKLTAAVADPTQSTWLATGLTVGVGLTTMIKVCEAPVQVMPALVYTGVTVISAVTGDKPVLTATNGGILLLTPLDASPIEGALLVHWNTSDPVGPVVGLLKPIDAVVCPLHNIWLAIGFTIGVGFTVMVKLTGSPGQPPKTGVTVMVAVIGPLVALVVTNGSISPLPLAARPMPVLVLVQL